MRAAVPLTRFELMNRIPIPTVLVATALVVIFVIYMITFQVRFSEAAVKVRFGQANEKSVIDGRQEGQVGLHFKLPPPIETVRTVDLRLRTLETKETEVKTRDGHNLLVGLYAFYRVADPLLYTKRVSSDAKLPELLRVRLNQARAVVMGQHALADLVNLDQALVERTHDAIAAQLLGYAAASVQTDYGVQLVEIGVRQIALPAEATQKVQEAMVQERENLAARYRAEGSGIADAIRSRAESAKNAILAFARTKAQEIESEGVQATARILASIGEQDQDFFIFLRQMQALEDAFRNRTTIVLDAQQFPELVRPFMNPLLGGAATPQAAPSTPRRTGADKPEEGVNER